MRLTPTLQVLNERPPNGRSRDTPALGRLLAPLGGDGAKSVPVSRKDNLIRRNNVPSLRPKEFRVGRSLVLHQAARSGCAC